MGIFDFLAGQFIDVIHWTDDTRDTMVWRFEREGHEIKMGAKLTVREGQVAVFVHEELAQAMGLPNDSPQARPSIFNDDDEFGLLTTHDEYLLRMLYDPRLTPGMTAAQAEPIVRQIASELLNTPS